VQTSAWHGTWGILYEFLRVITHPRVLRAPWPAVRARGFLEAVLAAPALGILTPTERHPQVLAELLPEIPHPAGNLMHDAHTATLTCQHGIRRVATRNTDIHRFPFLEPLDPMA
jgi:predicted nucleic acid-binding protein